MSLLPKSSPHLVAEETTGRAVVDVAVGDEDRREILSLPPFLCHVEFPCIMAVRERHEEQKKRCKLKPILLIIIMTILYFAFHFATFG